MNLKKILFSTAILLNLNTFSQQDSLAPIKIKEKKILQTSEIPVANSKYYYEMQSNPNPEKPYLTYYKFIKYKDTTKIIKDKIEIIKYNIDLNNNGEIDVRGYYRYTYPLNGEKIQIIFENKTKYKKWQIHFSEQIYNKKRDIIKQKEAFDFNGDLIIDLIKYYTYKYNYKNKTRKTTIKIDDKANGIIDDTHIIYEKI